MQSGMIALGRYGARGKQQLVLIRPTPKGLVLHGLFYADEVKSFEDVDLGDAIELKDEEIKLANQLIDQLSAKSFNSSLRSSLFFVTIILLGTKLWLDCRAFQARVKYTSHSHQPCNKN